LGGYAPSVIANSSEIVGWKPDKLALKDKNTGNKVAFSQVLRFRISRFEGEKNDKLPIPKDLLSQSFRRDGNEFIVDIEANKEHYEFVLPNPLAFRDVHSDNFVNIDPDNYKFLKLSDTHFVLNLYI